MECHSAFLTKIKPVKLILACMLGHFILLFSTAHAFESIKQRHEQGTISKENKTVELIFDDDQKKESDKGFMADAELILHSRTYLFDHNRDSDPVTGRIKNDRYSVATGGWITFKSGYFKDWLGVGLTQYGSFKLDGTQHEDGALLLGPGQDSINVLGQAYVELLHPYGNFKVYRQKINTPFMNSNDNRMVPQTFQAYKFSSSRNSEFDYILAYADKIKTRNSNSFEDINQGVDNDEGVWLAGIRKRFTPLFRAGVISYHAEDYVNIHYAELDGTYRFSDQAKIKYALQYIKEDATGKEQGGDIDTDAWGFRLVYSLSDWQLFLNYTDVDTQHDIIFPWSSYAGYNSVQVNDFNRAGEEAIGLGAAYDFSQLGFKGLTAKIQYIDGNTPDSGQSASSDQSEVNYDLRYLFQTGVLEGLSARVRYADVKRQPFTSQNQGKLKGLDEDQFRIIVNYEIKL